jgi:predicted nucleic acid-binding protein
LREQQHELLKHYDSFFTNFSLKLVDVTPAIIERATHLRANHGFRTPDALHLATAIEEHAEVFLTGDVTLARCPDIKVDVL